MPSSFPCPTASRTSRHGSRCGLLAPRAYRKTLASRKSLATAVLEFLLQIAPFWQRRVWKAQKELRGARSAATVRDVQILGTSRVADHVGNGSTTASGEAFEGSELQRLHEDLNALRLGHFPSMHMHMCMS